MKTEAVFTLLVPRVHFQGKPQPRDPGDELVPEAAINGYAEVLVTFNAADILPVAPEFGVRVVRPEAMLR